MWLSISLVLAFCCSIVQSRVTFDTSEVLDTVDLKGAMGSANFRCFAGCRVYSPTSNDKIVIVDSTGKEWKNLYDLSVMTMGVSLELPPSKDLYTLKNKGGPDPQFVFYAVEKGAMHYMSNVVYINGLGSPTTISAKNDAIVTVLSATGTIRFAGFQGDFSGPLLTVHATPFDSIGKCKAVYNANTASTIPSTDFPVYGPIATINFKQNGAKSVTVSGQVSKTTTGVGTSAVYVSPGYVGCPNINTLYTCLPRIVDIYSMDVLTNSNGLHVVATADYSIANQANALKLTLNEEYSLSGTNTFSKTTDATTVKIIVSWNYLDDTDRFAMQIDVTNNGAGPGPGPVATTQKPGPGPVITTAKGGVDHTTSESVKPFGMFSSSLILVVSLFLSIR